MRLIKSTPKGKNRVYDIEVADVHNFYANGINVHNCATDGGVSVIKDNGTVISGGEDNASWSVNKLIIDSNYTIWACEGGDYSPGLQLMSYAPYASVASIGVGTLGYQLTNQVTTAYGRNTSWPFILGSYGARENEHAAGKEYLFNGSRNGLTFLQDNVSDRISSMVAYATTSYNTGWMHGDIKGAFLSDTDTTNVTGTELWPEGDFADANEWSSASAEWTISGGNATVSDGDGGYSFLGSSSGTLTNGKKYVLFFTISNYSGGRLEAAQANSSNIQILFSANGSYSQVINYTGTSGSGLGIYGYGGGAVGFTLDNLYLRELEEEDRSVNDKGLQVFGTITKSPVATGAELVAYSGFSASNYLQQPYNSDLLFGTDDFCITGWVNNTAPSNSVYEDILTFGNIGVVGYGNREPGNWLIQLNKAHGFNMYYRTNAAVEASGWSNLGTSGNFSKYSLNGLGIWYKITIVRRGNKIYSYTNDDLLGSKDIVGSFTTSSNLSDMRLTFGYEGGNSYGPYVALYSKLALWRISRSAPSTEQIKKMYYDEKHLFEENAKATLYGSSDAVTALAHDDSTNLLHVGTSAGRSDFQGLRRINNTTTAVTTAISASNGLIAEQ